MPDWIGFFVSFGIFAGIVVSVFIVCFLVQMFNLVKNTNELIKKLLTEKKS